MMKGIFQSKISSKGQIVIPKNIREKANFKEGEHLIGYLDKNNKLHLGLLDMNKLKELARSL